MEFLKDKKYNILLCGPKIQILLVKLTFKNTAKKKKKKIIHHYFNSTNNKNKKTQHIKSKKGTRSEDSEVICSAS